MEDKLRVGGGRWVGGGLDGHRAVRRALAVMSAG